MGWADDRGRYVFIAACVTACTGEASLRSASVDAATREASRADAPGAGAGGTPHRRDASLGGSGPRGPCDGAFVPDIDPNVTPPAECVAPCVWDLFKSCLPQGPCGSGNDWRSEILHVALHVDRIEVW